MFMDTDLLNNCNIKIENKLTAKITDKLPKPIIYSASKYGIESKYTGNGVKIVILDSGYPRHKDIKIEGEKVSFCEDNMNADDKVGHSTLVSGIIKSNNKNAIVGLAPLSRIYYGKVVNNRKQCSFNALIAGILWSIVKEVDIIVLALGTQYDYTVFHDAIKKANAYGMIILAAGGDNISEKSVEIDYPARYKEVFSTGYLTRSKIKNQIIKEKVDFCLGGSSLYTTYLNNKYVRVSGSSVSTSFFAGLAALYVERYKKYDNNKKKISSLVYSDLLKISM